MTRQISPQPVHLVVRVESGKGIPICGLEGGSHVTYVNIVNCEDCKIKIKSWGFD